VIKVEKVDSAYLVFDEKECESLYWNRYFGRPVNKQKPKLGDLLSPLRLSRIEVLYLVEKQEVVVYKQGRRIRLAQPTGRSELLYLIYKDLRERGFVVRSGIKFGATFAVYLKGPGIDHAPFLVQVIQPEHKLTGTEVIRAGRLSHGIRKSFIFATFDKETGPIYATLQWVKS
jgi:tRNA-intron endonuclease